MFKTKQMRLTLVMLLISFSCFSQNELELHISSLKTVTDTVAGERKFALHYTLKNLTDKKLSFFFVPRGFGGSLSNKLFYKCYQNGEYLDSGQLLNTYSERSRKIDLQALNLEGKTQKEQDSIVLKYLREQLNFEADSIKTKISGSQIDYQGYLEENAEKRLLNQIYTIEPNAEVAFTEKLFWNEERYFTVDPHEYYVDENARHEFEITLVLMKEPFKSKLSDEKYKEIMADKNFIKGVFVSNRVPIDFGK